jgi:hypothetical protein
LQLPPADEGDGAGPTRGVDAPGHVAVVVTPPGNPDMSIVPGAAALAPPKPSQLCQYETHVTTGLGLGNLPSQSPIQKLTQS